MTILRTGTVIFFFSFLMIDTGRKTHTFDSVVVTGVVVEVVVVVVSFFYFSIVCISARLAGL